MLSIQVLLLSGSALYENVLDSLVGKASDRQSEDVGSSPAPVYNIFITHCTVLNTDCAITIYNVDMFNDHVSMSQQNNHAKPLILGIF